MYGEKYSNIIIDMSLLYSRAYYVSQHLTHKLSDGTVLITGGIYTALKMLQKLERNYLSEYGEVYCVFDNTHSGETRRKVIDPQYKANREGVKKDPSFYQGLDYLFSILINYKSNYNLVKKTGYEADDLIQPLVQELKAEALLVSNDLDWSRAISEDVHLAIYDNHKKDYKIYNPTRFKNKYGYSPLGNAVTIYKTFKGDKSDNIPIGIPRFPTEALLKLVELYADRNIYDIMRDVDSLNFLSKTWRDKIKENKSRLFLNYKLVNFIPAELTEEDIYTSDFKEKKLKFIYESLGFKISEIDSRIKTDTKKNGNTDFFKRKGIERA